MIRYTVKKKQTKKQETNLSIYALLRVCMCVFVWILDSLDNQQMINVCIYFYFDDVRTCRRRVPSIVLENLIHNSWILQSNSAVCIQYSQTQRQTENSNANNGLILDFRQRFLCFHVIRIVAPASIVCTLREISSILETAFLLIESWYKNEHAN